MNIKQTLADVTEGLALAGPLLERFATTDSATGKAIIEGAKSLLDLAARTIGGAEDFSEQTARLVASFRALKAKGELATVDFQDLAADITANTAALNAAVAGNRKS